jgi:hypothetical protein
MSTPSPIVTPNLWDLGADPARLESAAAAWRRMAGTAEQSAITAARRLIANGSRAFHGTVVSDLRAYARLVTLIADVLDETAAALRHWQGWLTSDLATLAASVPLSTLDDDRLRFAPVDTGQAARVHAAIAEAEDLWVQVDDVLTSGEQALCQAWRDLGELAQPR